MRVIMMAAVVPALMLAACQQAEAPPAGNAAGAGTEAPTQTGGAPAAATPALWNGGQAKPLDIQVAHPNGTVLQLTSIQSRQTDTAVGIRVINGRDDEIELNSFPNNRKGFLLLDTGERLYLSPPATNAKLAVPAGQTFEGELVFTGRLPAAKSATLMLNEDASTSSEYSSRPGFRIDLPLGGAQ
ncbi:hypothetical protein ABC347_00545 [Sphingomonas sp. 1P06PA]|uniref:hypothetical protein n=1 Tax=Sphingomonas sp. 1P06PA TaxID=554121 RepID=UPI0039A51492